MSRLHAAVEPYELGHLGTSDGHEVYWETCGIPTGKPALVVHGGPGSGCTPWQRRLFDPRAYRVVLFDQRNCGRSRPHASQPGIDLGTNTTHHLLADIERIRARLGIERWMVVGGSWGSTLALAYAEEHPERVTELVLFAVTAGLRREFDRVFRGGLAARFPGPWRRLRAAVASDQSADSAVIEEVYRKLFDPDPEVCGRVAHAWCLWESAISEWPPVTTLLPRFRDPSYALAFARIVSHYVCHDAWLEDGALLRGTARLANLPVILVDGRHDPQTTETAQELVARLPLARHVVVDDASHSAVGSGLEAAIVRATDEFSTR